MIQIKLSLILSIYVVHHLRNSWFACCMIKKLKCLKPELNQRQPPDNFQQSSILSTVIESPSPPPPIREHFCPLFIQIAQMGLILRRWNLILPRTPPPTPFLYSAVTHPIQGYVRTKNTPKGPSPPKNTPFPDLNLKVGKMNYLLGNLYPNWAKCLKSGQNFSRSGQKNLFIYALNYWPIPNIDALGF